MRENLGMRLYSLSACLRLPVPFALKVTAAITTVEDALGLPSPHELATEREEEEGEGEKEREKRDGFEEERKGEGGSEQTESMFNTQKQLQILYHYLFFAGIVEHDVNSQQTSPGSVPVAQQVDPDQTQEQSPTTIGAFSGFFTGIATAVEQKVSQTFSLSQLSLSRYGYTYSFLTL